MTPAGSPDGRGDGARLLLFARVPRPGRAKTRLAPALGAEGASRLYRALLQDTVEAMRRVGVPVEIHAAGPEGSLDWFRQAFPDLPVVRQEGNGLGARLASGFEAAFAGGDRRVVAVGSDHPTLPPEHLERAFALLGRRDVVLGPGRDGGYYAVGIRGDAWPGARALFRDIPWSTSDVLSSTRHAAAEAGLTVEELPRWYDVDRPEDLALLRRDASRGSHSLRTLRALERLNGAGESSDDREGSPK